MNSNSQLIKLIHNDTTSTLIPCYISNSQNHVESKKTTNGFSIGTGSLSLAQNGTDWNQTSQSNGEKITNNRTINQATYNNSGSKRTTNKNINQHTYISNSQQLTLSPIQHSFTYLQCLHGQRPTYQWPHYTLPQFLCRNDFSNLNGLRPTSKRWHNC